MTATCRVTERSFNRFSSFQIRFLKGDFLPYSASRTTGHESLRCNVNDSGIEMYLNNGNR